MSQRDSVSFRARSEDLSEREIEGAIVLLDERTWEYLHLNQTGAWLWKQLATDSRSCAELSELLLRQFDITSEQASIDATAFVGELQRRGLLVAEGG